MKAASLAHQEEGQSGDAHPRSSKQSRLHGQVLVHLSGSAGELTEPLLRETTQKEKEVQTRQKLQF